MKKSYFILLLLFGVWFNVNGQAFQWAKLQQDTTVTTNLISCDGNNLISAATFFNTITLGNQVLSSNRFSNNGYLAKHDLAGNVIWAKHLIGVFRILKVQSDNNQNILVAGHYSDSLYIGSTIFNDKNSSGNPQGMSFIAKFNSNGTLLWAEKLPLFYLDFTIGTDGIDNVYVAGMYNIPITIGTVTLPNSGGIEDMFLAKFNPNGSFQWASAIGGTERTTYPVIIGNSNGTGIYLSGGYQKTGIYGGVFIRKYSNAGLLQWNKRIQDAWTDYSLSMDGSENLYLSGFCRSTLNFDNIPLTVSPAMQSGNILYIAKVTSSGKWKWAKKIASGNYFTSHQAATAKANNYLYLTAQYGGNPTFGNFPLPQIPNKANSFLAKIDTAGNPVEVFNMNSSIYLNNSEVVTDQYDNKYLTGQFMGIANFGSITLNNNAINFSGNTSNFLAKILDNANEINGSLFVDINGNAIKDAGEVPYKNGLIEISPGPNYFKTDSNGVYSAYLPSGTYNLQVVQPTNHYTFSPQNHSITFPGVGQTQTKYFALTPIPNRNDVKISVTNITPTRPGFATKYRITFENVGTTTLSDSLTLTYAANYLTFNSASTTPALQQAGKIKWYYQILQPNERRNIDVSFTVLTTTPINTKLKAIAVIKPLTTDYIGGNNYDTLNHVVTGSYDPNDKQVSYTKLTPAQVANGKLLDYVIRFQNTGNDTAFTVIVRDSISSKLHMPSFEILSASHPYTFRLLKNGMAEWRFDNIKLPDSTRNKTASHGFIRYRMQPKNNLILGDEIKSRAEIYFDFNTPVMTNYAVTRLSNITGIRKDNDNVQAFELYPNPAKNYVIVAAELKKQAPTTVILKNLLGQTISTTTLPANNQVHYQLPLNNLAKGVYIVQLETEAGRQTQRLVIQ